jgi:hypothetical protein
MIQYFGAIFGAALGLLIVFIWSKIFSTPPLGAAGFFILACSYQTFKQFGDED